MEVSGVISGGAIHTPAPESENPTLRILARNGVVGWTGIREGVLEKLSDMGASDKATLKGVRFSSTGTLLHKLVRTGDAEKDIKYVPDLATIVGIDTLNVSGQTALHMAIADEKPEMVKALIDAGSNPDAEFDFGSTRYSAKAFAEMNNKLCENENTVLIVSYLNPAEGESE